MLDQHPADRRIKQGKRGWARALSPKSGNEKSFLFPAALEHGITKLAYENLVMSARTCIFDGFRHELIDQEPDRNCLIGRRSDDPGDDLIGPILADGGP